MKNNQQFDERFLAKLDRLDGEGRRLLVTRILRERDFYESIFDSLQVGLLIINASLAIRNINSAATVMLGIPETAIGDRIDRYFKHIDWERLRQTPPDDWGQMSRREIEVFYPEHRYFDLYVLPAPERPDAQMTDMPLATLILNDVTAMMENSEKNVETQKVKAITQLAAGVAHELGNPLNALGIHLQILKRKLKNQDDVVLRESVAKFIGIAEQETERLDSIVKNFLNAVRPGRLNLSAIDLRQIVMEGVEFLRPELEAKNIEIVTSFPDVMSVISGDENQLKQVVYNIVKNALQAMGDGGQLKIVCEIDDVFVNLKISDTGSGLTQEQLSHIIEPYFTTKMEGTGLGLLIVDRIVRAHGGELAFDSTPGRGTTVTISLPRYARRIRQLAQPAEKTENC